MSNSIHVAPVIQAKTAHTTLQSAEAISLVVEAYPGGPIRSVPKALYGGLLTQIQTRIPELIRGVKYTAVQLCTEIYWDQKIDASDHNLAGKCIAIMVTRGEIQLLAAGKNACNACLYEVP